MTSFPTPPQHVAPYVRVLGHKDAVNFLLTFGGGEVYLTASPKGRSRLVEVVGSERAAELAEALGQLKVRIPTAKPWIAQCLRTEGLPVAEIARRLHTADKTVRGWLRLNAAGSGPPDDRQLQLF